MAAYVGGLKGPLKHVHGMVLSRDIFQRLWSTDRSVISKSRGFEDERRILLFLNPWLKLVVLLGGS